jgi:glc operon protein GlcG
MTTELNLDYGEARRAIDAIVAEVERRGKAAVVAVADSRGELIAFVRMDGAPCSSITIAINKSFTAARAGKPTFDVGQRARDENIAYYGDARYIGWGGGVPVKKHGKVIGSVAVSGLPQEEDMEIVELGVSAI